MYIIQYEVYGRYKYFDNIRFSMTKFEWVSIESNLLSIFLRFEYPPLHGIFHLRGHTSNSSKAENVRGTDHKSTEHYTDTKRLTNERPLKFNIVILKQRIGKTFLGGSVSIRTPLLSSFHVLSKILMAGDFPAFTSLGMDARKRYQPFTNTDTVF